jgi:transglutaminase-like putative cysteine protease
VGTEKNAYLMCSALRKWVHGHLEVTGEIGITRPASDVLKSNKGVCRDTAILLGAMARSLGIPAKIATGLVYSGDAFYYHAWTECYVGQWVPFDGTLDGDFVDATHIKLAEGDATTMFSVSRVIGSLKLSVKSYK